MDLPDRPPTRVRLYGLFWMTKRTYLTIQAVGLVVLLGLLVAGGVAMVTSGRWLPDLGEGLSLSAFLIAFFWLSLLTLFLEAVETTVVLKKFAREEALDRAKYSAHDTQPFAPRHAATDPQAVQPPPGVQPPQP
jgi:hypothetical protein